MTYQEMKSNPDLCSILDYSPQLPHPKQLNFLKLKCKEALFGGAAGPGKSSALLMAALQYVHKPKYSAVVIRNTMKNLEQPGGLIPRSIEWMVSKADYNATARQWTFASGATLKFSYMSTYKDMENFQSTEFQYISFDELTQFPEEYYLYLFSRLRQTLDVDVPERVRSASNPGGSYGDWVKQRFVPPAAEEDRRNNRLKDVYYTREDEDTLV